MSASSIHLKLTGIDGESTSNLHKDEIEVDSWTWGVSNADAPGKGGGLSAGKPTFSDLTFTHKIDRASPLLWKSCATGSHINQGTLSVARLGVSTLEYVVIKLRDVLVTAVTLADVTSDAQPPVETVSLSFSKVEYGYKPQKPNGSLGPAIEFKFDLITNK